MFSKQQRPLPTARIVSNSAKTLALVDKSGILLGDDCYWNPEKLANPHGAIIGSSGSGKTQTLKAIAYSILKQYPTKLIIIDFHGDQEIPGEVCYRINMESSHGINPLVINLDREGGGPNLQSIMIAMLLKKVLRLGPNQEGMILETIKKCYSDRGITQDNYQSWTNDPPNFDDLEEELNRRASTQFKDDEVEKLALSINPFSLSIGQPNQSGIYFVFNEKGLLYVGSSTNIHRRTSRYHHVITPLREKGIDPIIRFYPYPSDWLQLLTLENYFITTLKPPLNEAVLRKECKESAKLKLKLAATFQYGIFSRPQPSLNQKHIRVDLSKLPPELASIAADSLANQLMNSHRLLGESLSKIPRTILFIDEAKEMESSKACDRITADGRKYGLGLWVATQRCQHLTPEVLSNTITKIVLPVDASEVVNTGKKFRFDAQVIASLQPLNALVRLGTDSFKIKIKAYYERV